MSDPTILNPDEAGELPLDLDGVRLPSRLEQAYTLKSQLAERGAEAVLIRATPHAGGADVVIKLYKRQLGDRNRILDSIRDANPAHVVELVDYGTSEGIGYEVLEYIEGGDLRQYLTSCGGRLTEGQCLDVLVELTDAIEALHALGDPPLAHGDIKPGNVLVRTREPELDLVLADFGLATFDHKQITGHRATPRWSDPASSSGIREPEGDWWSLGVMVYWALTGSHILETLDDASAVKFLQSKNVPLDALPADLKRDWRCLCQGLLTRDPSQRWGNAQIQRWRDGEAPELGSQWDAPPEPLVVTVEAPRTTPPMRFQGQEYRTPEALGLALAKNWDAAVDLISNRDEHLANSLSEFAASANDLDLRTAARQILTSSDRAELILIRLIATLAPNLTPCYRGFTINREGLLALTREAATNPRGKAAGIVTSLATERAFVGWDVREGGDLKYADLLKRWDAAVEQWRQDVEPHTKQPHWVEARSRILLALLDRSEAADLSRQAAKAGGREAREVAWFHSLIDRVRSDTGHSMAAIELAPLAVQEARAQRVKQEAAREEAGRARAADSMLRTPRTARLLGWCLVLQGVMLLAWFSVRVWGPRSADSGPEIREGLESILPWQIGDWLVVVSDPRIILPLFVTSATLFWRATRRAGSHLVARHPLERRVMQAAIGVTTLTTPVLAPVTAIGWARGLRRYAPDELRRSDFLRSAALFIGSLTTILGMLLVLKVHPAYLSDTPWPFVGWPVGFEVANSFGTNLLWNPLSVAFADSVGPPPPGALMFTMLMCAAGPLLLWLGARGYRTQPDEWSILTVGLLVPGIICSANLLLIYLPLDLHSPGNVAIWIALVILGMWAFMRIRRRRRP
ncbi:MAG: protein kinase [Actinobacteria bacterium]|nr:protein kinase [Actinomycetota bacterium]